MKKKILSIFDAISVLALVLAATIAMSCVLVSNEVFAAWNGTPAAKFQSGSGTASNPYIIATPAQLGKFLLGLNSTVTYEGQHFALAADIDMTGGTWDISGTTFNGTLDGRGYTVTAECPFLGTIGKSGTVQGMNYVCTVTVGRSLFCLVNQGTIFGCVVKGNASSSVLDDEYSTVGLLCGKNSGTIKSCGAIGDVYAYGEGDSDAEAGMVAINDVNGKILNCYAAVSVSASAPGRYDTAWAGPVVGQLSGGTVTDCIFDNTLYTFSVANATGLPTADMKSGTALNYLGSSTPAYCSWTLDSTFDGYPHLYHLAHTYTAYVSGYKGQDIVIYNGTSMNVSLTTTGGSAYYTTDSSVADPKYFTSGSSVRVSGDTTIAMASRYNGEFGTVTRQRFIGLSGSGTAADPYVISQKYQLWLPELLPTAHFVLANDLTFTDADYTSAGVYPGGWDPIQSFSGTFDGRGHAIYGLKGNRGGLFEATSGTVKNLRMVDHRLAGPGDLGAIADRNTGTISRCYTKSAYTLTDLPSVGSTDTQAMVGGVVGENGGTIEYCRNDGIVLVTRVAHSSKVYIGGIAGYSYNDTITHCINTGALIYGNSNSNNMADFVHFGGIAGRGSMDNCKAVQNIYLNDGTDYDVYVAGLNGLRSTGHAWYCIADYTFYKQATTGGGVAKYAYSACTSSYCYDAKAVRLPADCPDLTFGYGGNWWVSNEGIIPQGVIGADGHAWVLKTSGQILPTCTAKGDAWLECAICGQGSGSVSELQIIQALGHVWQDADCENPKTCSDCGAKNGTALGHTGGTATCADQAVCTRCEQPYGVTDKTNHIGKTELRNQVDATCIQKGYTGDIHCASCDEKLESGETVALTGHNEVNDVCTVCGAVKISEITFPDVNFRTFIMENIVGASDNWLTQAELSQVKTMSANHISIERLTGIEHFTALTSLYCYNNKLSELDVSKNTQLKTLYCNVNQLTALDVSNNLLLETLDCNTNQLTTLDLSKNTQLKDLACEHNKLTALNVANNTLLEVLYCNNNSLTELDISKNTELKRLHCQNNLLEVLDTAGNTKLEVLNCSNNCLTSLGFNNKYQYWTPSCSGNVYTIDVVNNQFDLNDLPGDFDITLAGNWSGGTVNGSILTVSGDKVTYTYKIYHKQLAGGAFTDVKRVNFTLIVRGYACQHNWNDATCTEPKTCSKCKITEGSALDHTGGTADCTSQAICTLCQQPYGEVNKANHTGGTKLVDRVDATCMVNGYSGDIYCTSCDEKLESGKVTVAPGHNMGQWFVTQEATCAAEGEKRRDCTNCDAFETDTIPVTDHSYQSVVTAPTCKDQGYTTYTCVCGDSYKADYKDALDHSWGAWQETSAASCTAEGEKRRDCTRCDAFETDKIPMTDHVWDEGVITKEPTYQQTGVKTYTCSVCKGTKTEDIPVLTEVIRPDAIEGEYAEEINLWLKIFVPDSFKHEAAQVVMTKQGGYGVETVTIKGSDLGNADAKGRYLLKMGIASGEMTSKVTYEFYDVNGNKMNIVTSSGKELGQAATFSLLNYAQSMLRSGTDAQKKMVAAMLTYGGYAQKYFGVDAQNPAYNLLTQMGMAVPSLDGVTADLITDRTIVADGGNGIKATGMQTFLDSAIYLRVYFTLAAGADIDDYKFVLTYAKPDGTVDTMELEAGYEAGKNRYYADIEDIPAAYLDYMYNITVTNTKTGATYSITTSVIVWVRNSLLSSANEDQKNLLKAIYLYNQAANEFFGK